MGSLTKQKGFSKIETYDALIENLKYKINCIDGNKYFCHYTTIEAAVGIITNRTWYIGSPTNMNDGLELSHGDKAVWDKMFFASFMEEPHESIAMWSMYAQPWENGVMIRIPVSAFKRWIQTGQKIQSADEVTKKPNEDDITSHATLSFYAVAYTNAESKQNASEEILQCGTLKNEILKDVLNQRDLIGYIKDDAWSYENEYRLRVDVEIDSLESLGAVALAVPDEVINSMEIVTGPRFKRSILSLLDNESGQQMCIPKLRKSIFDGKLNSVYCDRCARGSAL